MTDYKKLLDAANAAACRASAARAAWSEAQRFLAAHRATANTAASSARGWDEWFERKTTLTRDCAKAGAAYHSARAAAATAGERLRKAQEAQVSDTWAVTQPRLGLYHPGADRRFNPGGE